MTLKELIELWDKLGEIPINKKEEIELDFQTSEISFKKGTDRYDIWHWFDEELEWIAPQYTLEDLMYHKIKEI
jgi:hypothetical protein